MKLTWIGRQKTAPKYGLMAHGKHFNASAADGKSFIRQGLATEGFKYFSTEQPKKKTKEK